LVILYVVIVRVDHELGERTCLTAGRATEHGSVRERDRLRLLLIRTLHRELLWWRLCASNEPCRNDHAENADYFVFHISPVPFVSVISNLIYPVFAHS